MSSVRWLPFFLFGGLGFGNWAGHRYDVACIFFAMSFVMGLLNRFLDIWSNRA